VPMTPFIDLEELCRGDTDILPEPAHEVETLLETVLTQVIAPDAAEVALPTAVQEVEGHSVSRFQVCQNALVHLFDDSGSLMSGDERIEDLLIPQEESLFQRADSTSLDADKDLLTPNGRLIPIDNPEIFRSVQYCRFHYQPLLWLKENFP